MSEANKLSRGTVANGGFGDPDLTPRPLRVHKQEQIGTAITINPSLSLSKSQTQKISQALAPSKKHWAQVNSSQLDLCRQHLAAPTSQWARRNAFLHVHKQRQSEPIISNTASLNAISTEPIGFSASDPPARTRDSCPTMSELGSYSDSSKAIVRSKPSSRRAFTAANHKSQNLLSPVHEVSSSASAYSAQQKGQRRAVTNMEISYKDLNTLNSIPHPKLRKQHSAKNSLVSRMISGLTSRTHVSNAASRGERNARLIPRTFSTPTPSPTSEDILSSRKSTSSTGTDAYHGRKIDNALAAFPTPPTSAATSPTAAVSFDSGHSMSRHSMSRPSMDRTRIKELCKPANAILMGAELTLTPEFDQLSSAEERTMLVSLDIKGTTNSTSSVQDTWSQHTGLDIVVVIDNS